MSMSSGYLISGEHARVPTCSIKNILYYNKKVNWKLNFKVQLLIYENSFGQQRIV